MGANYKHNEVYETLENILGSEMFASSPRAQDFLKYIVTETISGRSKTLSGTTIGQDVFEKGAEFDPVHDSVVRVYARRLRYMLRDYYLEYPAHAPLIITIPKGRYKPSFERNSNYQTAKETLGLSHLNPQPKFSDAKLLILVGLSTVVASFLLMWGWSELQLKSSPQAKLGQFSHLTSSYPMIAVAPFKNETGVEDYDFLEEGLQKKMVEDLSRFSLIRPIIYKNPYETLITQNGESYDYVFSGLILSVKPELDLYLKLMDLESSTLIYERRIRRSNESSEYFDSLSEIVSELSGNFAGLEGAIVEKRLETIEKQIDNETDKMSNLEAFECFGLVGFLLENPEPSLYKRVYLCLEEYVKEDPNNSTLLSAFGWMTYIGAVSYEPVLMARSVNPDINAENGVKMIERAVEIDPNDAWAQQTLSTFKSTKGDTQGALKHAELAVIANPGDPDNLTWLSSRLAGVGQWERSLSLAQEALDRNPKPSSHYYHPFFLWALHNDNPAAMQIAADQIAELDDYYTIIFSYLAAVANDDSSRMTELQPDIDTMAARNDDNIMSVAEVLIEPESLRAKARELFIKSGMTPAKVSNPTD